MEKPHPWVTGAAFAIASAEQRMRRMGQRMNMMQQMMKQMHELQEEAMGMK
jgi:hypothetical protein